MAVDTERLTAELAAVAARYGLQFEVRPIWFNFRFEVSLIQRKPRLEGNQPVLKIERSE
jgi:hypothetical protein